ALARRVDEEREQGLSHVGGSVAVPFRVHEQRRRRDLGGVVVGPPGGEELIAVLLDAVGRADDRRIHPCPGGGGGGGRVGPGGDRAGGDQRRLFVLGHAGEPASLRLFARDRAVSPERARRP